VLSYTFFFSSLILVCNYPVLNGKNGYVLGLIMGSSAAERLCAPVNVFIGGIDSSVVMIKSYLEEMTESELHATMTSGFATIAGAVIAAYISFGAPAKHLLAASIMSAPAALAISKVVYPETGVSKTSVGTKIGVTRQQESNSIEAAANGASIAVKLLLNAFLALIAMLDVFLGGIGSLIGQDLSFVSICSVLFVPFTWLMGTEVEN
jgi:nucleoside permease NupC